VCVLRCAGVCLGAVRRLQRHLWTETHLSPPFLLVSWQAFSPTLKTSAQIPAKHRWTFVRLQAIAWIHVRQCTVSALQGACCTLPVRANQMCCPGLVSWCKLRLPNLVTFPLLCCDSPICQRHPIRPHLLSPVFRTRQPLLSTASAPACLKQSSSRRSFVPECRADFSLHEECTATRRNISHHLLVMSPSVAELSVFHLSEYDAIQSSCSETSIVSHWSARPYIAAGSVTNMRNKVLGRKVDPSCSDPSRPVPSRPVPSLLLCRLKTQGPVCPLSVTELVSECHGGFWLGNAREPENGGTEGNIREERLVTGSFKMWTHRHAKCRLNQMIDGKESHAEHVAEKIWAWKMVFRNSTLFAVHSANCKTAYSGM
jgi:hypothetical protein